LPKRRFEVVLQANDITVISDYAHHPSEIAALVQMARAQHSGRLIAVFQPHRYTRTLALGDNFPAAFEGVDKLILTPVYAASEDPIAGGRICDLYARFRDDSSICPQLARSLEQAWGYLRRELQPGDMLLVIGAGDVENIGAWAASEGFSGGRGIIASADDMPELSAKSSLKLNEPLGKKTTYGVGGTADYWVEVGSVEDLAAVLKRSHSSGLPFRVLGAGSNVLVSDLGVRGVVVRLTGDIFRGISLEDGVVRAGGALPISRLLDWLADQSLTGLEFLEGIPGSVGGIVRMNGGAYGSEIREKVVWIRGLNRDGSECTLRADALKWGYRGCQSLEGVVVVEVGLALNEGDSESIRCERGAIAGRRSWQRGLRCSGSVFRNPPDESAGRIVEALGLKSSRIGGAFVSDRHGNFVVADKDATASDVFALIEYLQFAVKDKRGIELVREVVYLE
jgi:UDP-N-acetylmuramate--alanine ligase